MMKREVYLINFVKSSKIKHLVATRGLEIPTMLKNLGFSVMYALY